jgi:UvrD/REP helicase N-terminal domain
MKHYVVVDELAIRECVEGQSYQSTHFEIGLNLARALVGERGVERVSPRLTLRWEKDVLYLLRSRAKAGYLLVNGEVLTGAPHPSGKKDEYGDALHVFQRVCRFALKRWNNMALSGPSEKWLSDQGIGVVFPFPKSKSTGFRVSLISGMTNERIEARHGDKILFAYAAGTGESGLTEDLWRDYRKAFEGLTIVRQSVEAQIEQADHIPSDPGYHPLILRNVPSSPIPYQAYDRWLSRLTVEQAKFVTSHSKLPQRVEGPAGTGKTLCLMLRAHFICQEALEAGEECHVLFIAHSEATRNSIEILLNAVCGDKYLGHRDQMTQSIEVCTLQEWCGQFIGEREVGRAQYLDQDAMQAKELRKEFLRDIVLDVRRQSPAAFKYLSEDCRDFFVSENVDYIAEILQHEIGVMIKGRASEMLESYLALPRVRYGLPALSDNDRRFVYGLYKRYQQVLQDYGSFDTDDIVLTAIGSLDTPIWRRRRPSEGYDAVMIDETHLFNMNELSIFHMITRRSDTPRIIFSIDRSQAPGERGITTSMVREVLSGASATGSDATTKLIFRCSPPIAKLAEAITAAGASLFTTFEDPLVDYSSLATAVEDEEADVPFYWECDCDADMVSAVLERHSALQRELKCTANEILLVGSTQHLVFGLRDAVVAAGERCVEILRRGDLEVVERERDDAVFVSHPDYVGGLEFRAVLIVGVDDGRVPLSDGAVKEEAKHFLEFRACNQLYVAITRARTRVELFMSKERGRSALLEHALVTGALVSKEAPSRG